MVADRVEGRELAREVCNVRLGGGRDFLYDAVTGDHAEVGRSVDGVDSDAGFSKVVYTANVMSEFDALAGSDRSNMAVLDGRGGTPLELDTVKLGGSAVGTNDSKSVCLPLGSKNRVRVVQEAHSLSAVVRNNSLNREVINGGHDSGTSNLDAEVYRECRSSG